MTQLGTAAILWDRKVNFILVFFSLGGVVRKVSDGNVEVMAQWRLFFPIEGCVDCVIEFCKFFHTRCSLF